MLHKPCWYYRYLGIAPRASEHEETLMSFELWHLLLRFFIMACGRVYEYIFPRRSF